MTAKLVIVAMNLLFLLVVAGVLGATSLERYITLDRSWGRISCIIEERGLKELVIL